MNQQHIPGSFGGDNSKLSDETRLECKICWHVYDPVKGDEYWQIAAGTPFSQLPAHWTCPQCDSKKIDFMVLED
jgi:rubredoxin